MESDVTVESSNVIKCSEQTKSIDISSQRHNEAIK